MQERAGIIIILILQSLDECVDELHPCFADGSHQRHQLPARECTGHDGLAERGGCRGAAEQPPNACSPQKISTTSHTATTSTDYSYYSRHRPVIFCCMLGNFNDDRRVQCGQVRAFVDQTFVEVSVLFHQNKKHRLSSNARVVHGSLPRSGLHQPGPGHHDGLQRGRRRSGVLYLHWRR